MQIYTVLKSDHRLVKQLLKQLEKTTEEAPQKRVQLLKQLKEAIVPHSRAEEQVFYDRLKKCEVKEADDLAFEGYEEHAVVDRLLEQLEATAPNDKRWTALLSVAKESLEHHIKEEEEELFEKARKAFDNKLATQMAEEFLQLKKGFLKEVKKGEMPQQKTSHEIVQKAA
ncbi:MAG: hemerythrin domain-containing protein [Bdellovibrionia bacterium]